MSKEFNLENPASRFITQPNTDNKQNTPNADNAPNTADDETKSKRLNLLVKPSVYEQFKKVATMKQDSVNNLINNIMENVVEENKEQIELYDKVFKDNDQ